MTRDDSRRANAKRVGVVALTALVVIVAAFLYLHSGSRADQFCERSRFVRKGSLSLWPPGATCPYGEPVRTETLINDWYWLLVCGIVIVAIAAAAWLTRWRTELAR